MLHRIAVRATWFVARQADDPAAQVVEIPGVSIHGGNPSVQSGARRPCACRACCGHGSVQEVRDLFVISMPGRKNGDRADLFLRQRRVVDVAEPSLLQWRMASKVRPLVSVEDLLTQEFRLYSLLPAQDELFLRTLFKVSLPASAGTVGDGRASWVSL